MAISNYSELKTAVSDWVDNTEITSKLPDFIALAESDLRVRAKLTEWDTSASVDVTTGSGPLPSDFLHAIAVTFGTVTSTLKYLTPPQITEYTADGTTGDPVWYSIIGSNLHVYPIATGTATLLYRARFTALSDSATSNSLLTLFPDAYLQGSIFQACVYLRDDTLASSSKALFEEAVERIRKYVYERRYGSAPLQMRAA